MTNPADVFPYAGAGARCDLCGAEGPLALVLMTGTGHRALPNGRVGFVRARGFYVCSAHPGQFVIGEPVATPRASTAPPGRDGVQLALFDSLALKVRSRSWREDAWREWRKRVS
jgi:hypothetical protein